MSRCDEDNVNESSAHKRNKKEKSLMQVMQLVK